MASLSSGGHSTTCPPHSLTKNAVIQNAFGKIFPTLVQGQKIKVRKDTPRSASTPVMLRTIFKKTEGEGSDPVVERDVVDTALDYGSKSPGFIPR